MYQHSFHEVLEGEEREQGVKNLFAKIMIENFPKLVKGDKHTSPGSTKSPKQGEPKEAHTKTHHD